MPSNSDTVFEGPVYSKGSNVIPARPDLARLSAHGRSYLPVSEVPAFYPTGTQFREDNLKIVGLTVSLLVYWLILASGGVSSARRSILNAAR